MMNIAFGAEYDGLHDIGECGYEWWYYDCVSEDSEFAVVLIIFRDIPMLPECIKERTLSPKKRGNYYDGISINVYHKKKKIAQKLLWSKKYQTVVNDATNSVHFQNNQIMYDSNTYSIYVDIEKGIDSRRIRFQANFVESNTYNNNQQHIDSSAHTWLAVAPVLSGECTLEIWEGESRKVHTMFNAHAYHDHNVGVLPVFHEFHSWYWGKVVCDFCTLVYYYVPQKPKQTLLQWSCLFLRNSNTCLILRDVVIQEQECTISYMGLRYCKRMVLTGYSNNDAVELTILHNNLIENGPFYLRFASIATLKIDSTIFTDTHSIGEFFHAERLKSKIVQTFIALPWIEV